jgi:hypothetical protein
MILRCRQGLTSNNPSPTLGSPLVSPGVAGCHVPGDTGHRMGRQGGLAESIASRPVGRTEI